MVALDKTAITRPKQPDLIPGYKLEALVGRGGMGEVHRATQLSLGRIVAVKILSTELAKDPQFVARFEKEAAALATLSHPHIVSIVDKGLTADGTYFLVMEFVDGQSLREMMRSPLMDTTQALKVTLEIVRAIDYAHSRGVIHRDLKPENILFDEQAGGIPKVSDFGLAGFIEGKDHSRYNVTDTHVAMGTAAYMAPEQRVDARTADHRADIYSLGVILYELLTGQLPLGNFDAPSVLKPGIDRRVDRIVARCLKPVPVDRYAKVSALIADLEPLVPVTTSMPPRKVGPLTRAYQVTHQVARSTLRAVNILMVTLAALFLIGAWLHARNKQGPEKELGEVVTAPLERQAPLLISGRQDETVERRLLALGPGPDHVKVLNFGRPVVWERNELSFKPASRTAAVGRATADVEDLEGTELTLSVDVATQPPPSGLWAALKRLVTGDAPNPASVLLLEGEGGRYAALSVGPARVTRFKWSLGSSNDSAMERQSFDGTTRLELQISKGELRALVGVNQDQREVGEPVPLAAGWRRYFQGMPKPTVACVEGACAFRNLRMEIKKERPPERAPEPPPPSPKPTAITKGPVRKPVRPPHVATKRPGHHRFW